jgi:hypothetical protein
MLLRRNVTSSSGARYPAHWLEPHCHCHESIALIDNERTGARRLGRSSDHYCRRDIQDRYCIYSSLQKLRCVGSLELTISAMGTPPCCKWPSVPVPVFERGFPYPICISVTRSRRYANARRRLPRGQGYSPIKATPFCPLSPLYGK